MRSLLIRVFVSFWSIIVVSITAAALLGYAYAERVRASVQDFQLGEAMLDASEALEDEGRDGLARWIESLPGAMSSLVFVLDEEGRDLLERPVPPPINVAFRRFSDRRARGFSPGPAAGNLRPARPFTELVGPDDRLYALFVLPPQATVGKWIAQRSRLGLALVMLLLSAAVSYLLARAISRPVGQLRESAVAIARGDLGTRVTDRVGRRSDEIGLLARDFDRMANELQRAARRQTELTQNVSHELRSPLARLRVALELARRKLGELPEFDVIDEETGKLDGLIGQILEFSRLDADARETLESIELCDTVQSVVEDARYEQAADDGDGITFIAEGRLPIRGYPGALRSGVENVLRNAIQHGSNGPAVEVRIARDGPDAVITVADEGGGVRDEELEQLFEPFYRAPSRQADAGSGLGLAIAARAIAMNGGSIRARNEGGGLCVEIRLPLDRRTDPAA